MPQKRNSSRHTERIHGRPLFAAVLAAVLIILAVISLHASGELQFVLGLSDESGTGSAPASVQEQLRVYYLDVGQGDSELIQITASSGEKFNVLIDAGDNGMEEQLLGELRKIGVHTIDAAVFTHPHADHIGGAAEVIRTLDVKDVYLPPVPDSMTPTTVTYENMLDAMAEKGLQYTDATAGKRLYDAPHITLEVLSPQRKDPWDNLNDWSVVLRLQFYDYAFLFTGDAEAPCEHALLKNNINVQADVLKLGHHGSSTSTTEPFLAACSPQYAIISCGKDNTYGHPHREVLELLKEYGIPYFRTDESGTILAYCDGKNLKVAPVIEW